ncbi:MAG TPA: hypothetical protein VFK02_20420 [Kofleriaceae bacterium]|nr:hypothetical protein [Kofleriaceae bacterium]
MSARLVSLGVSITTLVAVAGAIVVACYEVPAPDCGFLCGPEDRCPDGYTCADDHRCHRTGAPVGLMCPLLDGALPVMHDAPADTPTDMPTDPPDAPSDAADPVSDAANDATQDGPADAP